MPVERGLRALRGGKKKSASEPMPSEAYMVLRARAKKLEDLADALFKRAKRKPTRTTKSNGIQMSAELQAALRCGDAATKLWLQLQRLGPKILKGSAKSKWDGLL